MERRDADHEGTAGEESSGEGMERLREGGVLGEDQPEVSELGPPGPGVHLVADWVLHPGVRRQDEVRRQDRADRDHPYTGEMDFLGQLVPAEDPQSDEGGLEEESYECLEGQGS